MAITDMSARGEWRQGWPVLLPSLAGITLCSVNGYSLGVMFGPIEREYGWSRAEIAAGPMIISLMALVLSPVAGMAIDRFGPRRIAIIGSIAFCLLLANLGGTGDGVGSWWLRWALLGAAAMFVMPTTWTTAINSLFSRNRGKALAIALCGTGISAAFVPVLANALIERQGWRGAYVGLGIVFGVIVIPLVLLFFRGATDRARGGAPAPLPPAALTGYAVRAGLLSPAFLKLAAAVLVFGMTSCALTVNAVPVLLSKGFGSATAAAMAGLIGAGSIVGRIAGGFLLDRFDAKKVAAVSVSAPIATIALLMFAPGAGWSAALACLALGLSAGTEVDACAYLAARHLGMRSFGTLFGTMMGMVLFGAGVAPVVSNHVYDVTHSYDPMLIAVVPLSLVASALFLLLGRYPDFAPAPAARMAQDGLAASGAPMMPAQ